MLPLSTTATVSVAQPGEFGLTRLRSDRLAYIDGLRAIAILAVIAFHAHIPGFSGGFVGVDVFFVISGFLITRQIVNQLLTQRFSAMDFYARRMLRIVPPLLLVTVVTLCIAPLFPLLPHEQKALANSSAATAAMVSNYFFTSGTEYFSKRMEINPLLHTWSLGVEEQYYLLAPAFMGAIVFLATRRQWNPIRALLAFGALNISVSYIALAILSTTDHRLAFFSILTRAWQFALGGMLAVAMIQGLRIPARWRTALGICGLIGIAISVASYHDHMSYPGFAAGALPTIGALLLLASGLDDSRSPLIEVLCSGPAVAIGALSYSWYLWHWPLIDLARSLPIGEDSIWKDVTASAAALALSVPTYLFLERPLKAMRQTGFTPPLARRIVTGGIAGSALVAVLALLLGQSPLFNRSVHAIETGAPSERIAECLPTAAIPKFRHVTACVTGVPGEPNVVFWGDSHTLMMTPAAGWSARDAGRTAVVLGKTSCPPLQGVDVDFFNRRSCAFSNDEILLWLRNAGAISGVVLAARWLLYSEQDTPAGDANLPRLLWASPERPGSGYATLLGTGLTDLLTSLTPQRRVLIVAPSPELRHPIGDCLQRTQLTGQPKESCAVDRTAVERRQHVAMQLLRQVAAKFDNVRLIEPMEVLCDRSKCWPYGPKALFYLDADHLSPVAVEMLYRRFERDFRWVYGEGPAK